MIINTMIAFLLAWATASIIAPLMIKFAFKVGAVDIPKDERKIHSKPMPRIGGLSFILGFFVAIIYSLLTIELASPVNLFGFFIGLGIITAVGFLDDIYHIKAWQKLLGQIVAAILVIASGLRICYINIPFFALYGLNDVLSILITFFWIMITQKEKGT